jgi:predicted TIM-barrel fold metal-dependent hydrolase
VREQPLFCVATRRHQLREARRGQPLPCISDKPWLDQVREAPIEPARRIVDPHHHLWRRDDIGNYALDELWADTSSGHNVEKTVFVECGASYRTTGPEYMRCIGETEFVAEIAAASAKGGRRKAVISAIVATRARHRAEEVLAAHNDAGHGLFQGIQTQRTGSLPQAGHAGRALPRLYARRTFATA